MHRACASHFGQQNLESPILSLKVQMGAAAIAQVAAEFCAPVIKARFTEAVLPVQFTQWRAECGLPKNFKDHVFLESMAHRRINLDRQRIARVESALGHDAARFYMVSRNSHRLVAHSDRMSFASNLRSLSDAWTLTFVTSFLGKT